MKRILCGLMALLMIVCLCACGGGGSGGRTDAKLEGRYIAVTGEMLGVTMSGEDMEGFSVELQSGGKALLEIDGDSSNVKWKCDDETITLMVEGKELVAQRGVDSFVMEDMLGMGMDITFAKEGTDAAAPEQYLPEADRFMLGAWKSTAVTDVLEEPVDTIAADALQLEFTDDHQVQVTLGGEDLGVYKWSLLGDWGCLDDADDLSLSWDILDDGIMVDYSAGDDYFVFQCEKAE